MNQTKPITVMLHGKPVDWLKAVMAMREQVAAPLDSLRPCSEQVYLDAYAKAHQATYGTPFEVEG
ncbi:MAG: hypothetical protein ACRDC7_18170 [Aeromonas veronii]